MKTVILCGGYGTRIRDVAEEIPKPMIPIGGLPILWHVMKYYACYDHKDFVLCLGYKSHVIKDFFINYKIHTSDCTVFLSGKKDAVYHNGVEEHDWSVTLAETGLKSMTGARVKAINKYVEGDNDFMVTYGDGVGNIDIGKLIDFHKSHGKILTVTGVNPPGRFGEIETDGEGKVIGFNEKPQSLEGLISGGYFVCKKEIFDYLDDREDLVFEKEPMENLVKDGEMMVYKHAGFWQPMDTSREYRLLNELYNSKKAPWVVW